jgi:hypothetical protein
MTLTDMLLLAIAAILAGALNAVAGGGSFFSFPALVFTGVPDVQANATNTVVLWPGAVASTWAYRNELVSRLRVVVVLGIVSLIGGLLGALLLLQFRDQQEAFRQLVPYLLLVTTLLFAFGGKITQWLQHRIKFSPDSLVALVAVAIIQFFIAIYGGFFGGGMGVIMLAAFTMMGMDNIHIMNAIKSLLSVLIKGIAVATFIFSSVVFWPQAILMTIGAIIGGYGGAHYARKLDPAHVRRFAIGVGFVMTFLFFIRPYLYQ